MLIPEAPPAPAPNPLDASKQLAPKRAGTTQRGTELASLRRDLLIPLGLSGSPGGTNSTALY